MKVAMAIATLLDALATFGLLVIAAVLAYKGQTQNALLAVIAHSLWCIELRMKFSFPKGEK